MNTYDISYDMYDIQYIQLYISARIHTTTRTGLQHTITHTHIHSHQIPGKIRYFTFEIYSSHTSLPYFSSQILSSSICRGTNNNM